MLGETCDLLKSENLGRVWLTAKYESAAVKMMPH